MHEANAVRAAIQDALDEREAVVGGAGPEGTAPAPHAFQHLEFEILDPTRAAPEAVQVYAPVMLENVHLTGVSFDVFVRAVSCQLCQLLTHASPSDPVCTHCGAPLPRQEGRAIVAHWTRPVDEPAQRPLPRRDTATALAERHVPRRKHGR
jgi:hypothetical protein